MKVHFVFIPLMMFTGLTLGNYFPVAEIALPWGGSFVLDLAVIFLMMALPVYLHIDLLSGVSARSNPFSRSTRLYGPQHTILADSCSSHTQNRRPFSSAFLSLSSSPWPRLQRGRFTIRVTSSSKRELLLSLRTTSWSPSPQPSS